MAMNKGLIIGLGAFGLLLLAGGSSASAATPSGPTPSGPPPPAPPPPPPPPPPPAGLPDFLSWGPGQDHPVTPPPPPHPSAPPAPIPKAGERWEVVYAVNRRLDWLELSVAQQKFADRMPDQRLDSVIQSRSAPWTVTTLSTYTKDAAAPIPVGQQLRASDIVATMTAARKVA